VGGGQPFLAGAVNDMSASVTATHQVELRVAEWRLFAMVNTISAGAIRAEDLRGDQCGAGLGDGGRRKRQQRESRFVVSGPPLK
jgi:hypothetical protein